MYTAVHCVLTFAVCDTGGPPRPGMLPTPPMGGPPMMPMMGPPPHGMMPGGPGNKHVSLTELHLFSTSSFLSDSCSVVYPTSLKLGTGAESDGAVNGHKSHCLMLSSIFSISRVVVWLF